MDNSWSVSDIQTNMAHRLRSDSKMDRTIDFISLIQNLVTDKFGRISKEMMFFEARQSGFSEDESFQLLTILIKNGTLKESEEYIYF
jgi:hypothetical protein